MASLVDLVGFQLASQGVQTERKRPRRADLVVPHLAVDIQDVLFLNFRQRQHRPVFVERPGAAAGFLIAHLLRKSLGRNYLPLSPVNGRLHHELEFIRVAGKVMRQQDSAGAFLQTTFGARQAARL